MEFSPTAMTKYLVTGKMADQTHCQQGHEILSKQALRQASSMCSSYHQTFVGPIREGGWVLLCPSVTTNHVFAFIMLDTSLALKFTAFTDNIHSFRHE